MSTPVTMEDVCLYWLGFITARISIYLHHKLYFDHSKLPDFLFMLSTVYVYSIQELFLLDYARSTFAEYLRKYHKRQSTASSYFMARDTWLNVHNMQMRYHEWSEEGSTGCPLFLLKLFIFIFFFLPPWKFQRFELCFGHGRFHADFNIPHQYLQFNWKKTWVHKETVPP